VQPENEKRQPLQAPTRASPASFASQSIWELRRHNQIRMTKHSCRLDETNPKLQIMYNNTLDLKKCYRWSRQVKWGWFLVNAFTLISYHKNVAFEKTKDRKII
jgi:hypothetical protein